MLLLVGASKGGPGKTTLATNLAVMRAMAGFDVLLVDADVQGSASTWAEVRSEHGHQPKLTTISKLGKEAAFDIVNLKSKFDDIIVDAGGRDSPELRSVAVIADALLCPIRPSQLDMWALEFMEGIVSDARLRGNADLRAIACVNAANPNPVVKEGLEALDFIGEYDGFIPAKNIVFDRVAFRRAMRSGQSVVELGADGLKAAEDLDGIYAEVFNYGGERKPVST